jgi:hypothetical protein
MAVTLLLRCEPTEVHQSLTVSFVHSNCLSDSSGQPHSKRCVSVCGLRQKVTAKAEPTSHSHFFSQPNPMDNSVESRDSDEHPRFGLHLHRTPDCSESMNLHFQNGLTSIVAPVTVETFCRSSFFDCESMNLLCRRPIAMYLTSFPPRPWDLATADRC